MRFVQLSAGRFDGCLTDIRLDHMQVLRDVANASLAKQGCAWNGAMVFNLPMDAQGEGRFAGRALTFPTCLVSGSELSELCTPRRLDLACIAVDRRWLAETAESQGRASAIRRLRNLQPSLHRDTPRIWRLKTVVSDMFTDLPVLTRALDQAASRSAMENDVADLLLDILSEDEERLCIDTPQKRIAEKARAYVLDQAEQQPSVDDICRHVGVSRRKLQNCFHDSFGFSPTQFLRTMRLDRVRRELRAAGRGPVSIGDIAARWGFWHWSRFASDYRAMFGELPSETLRRPRA